MQNKHKEIISKKVIALERSKLLATNNHDDIWHQLESKINTSRKFNNYKTLIAAACFLIFVIVSFFVFSTSKNINTASKVKDNTIQVKVDSVINFQVIAKKNSANTKIQKLKPKAIPIFLNNHNAVVSESLVHKIPGDTPMVNLFKTDSLTNVVANNVDTIKNKVNPTRQRLKIVHYSELNKPSGNLVDNHLNKNVDLNYQKNNSSKSIFIHKLNLLN
jgi:hypothetical protein